MQVGHMKRPSTLYIKVNEVSDGNARNMAHNILFERLRTIANRSLNTQLYNTKKLNVSKNSKTQQQCQSSFDNEIKDARKALIKNNCFFHHLVSKSRYPQNFDLILKTADLITVRKYYYCDLG